MCKKYLRLNPKIMLQILFCLLLANISACSWLQPKTNNLLAITSDTQTRVAQQQWRLTYEQQQYLLQVIVERSADHWQWVLMNSLGQRLATVTSIAGVVRIEQQQSHPANKLLPDLLQAWQFSYWPLIDLQQHADKAWQFSGSHTHREVLFSGILRAAIDYSTQNPWQGSVQYYDKKRHFQLFIESQLLN